MTPFEKQAIRTLLILVVDELEQLGHAVLEGQGIGHMAELIRSMRNVLGAVGPYAKAPYTAPAMTALDAVDVAEKVLRSLTEDEIEQVLAKAAAWRQRGKR